MKQCTLLILLSVACLAGQQRTLLRGRIVDSQTGEQLVGVNVLVKGTYAGASSGLDGSYIIEGLSPGSYDLEVSYMGYKLIQRNGVSLTPGVAVEENFEMETTVLAFGQDVVVIG
ncbi:MAG: carboxypeptidase-like regulatory domain-containing protein, partial [Candidatus Marinimicrobia bacterium]|nr:carboxypeptidase-like regulatory domain-containing protein [Candidatus Neomarinimicrobiota bacterium]